MDTIVQNINLINSKSNMPDNDNGYEHKRKDMIIMEEKAVALYHRIMRHENFEAAASDLFGLLAIWRRHMNEITSELFTIFIGGNFLSAAAVTRTLIECYIYISLFKKEKNEKLLSEWYIWSMINSAIRQGDESKNKYAHILEEHCKLCGTTFEEKWKYYQKYKGMNAWLKNTLSMDKISTSALCKYLNEPEIYDDYQITSAFVHGQDIVAKQGPFTFYNSISATFHMMMSYIFKTICLFPLREDMKELLEELKKELTILCKKYHK